ncbi:MAG: cytochrome c3 family protein [Desulfuromonadaceae bacterium]|nr:cytochrome c3 family protein [Desulfuromonadaceae bacterium]
MLLDGGFLSHNDLNDALDEQKRSKELLGQVLVRMGMLTDSDVKIPLSIQQHLGSIDNAVRIVAGERQLLGALLVQSGHLTNEQLDFVIAEQQRNGERLGDTFTRLGILNERQLKALLDFQRNQESTDTSPLRLGELLIATGHITREHLENALYQQTKSNKNIGDVLIEAGHVTPNQVKQGVRLQQMLLKTVLAAIVSLAMNAGGPAIGAANAESNEMCTYSIQLQNSPMREEYIAKVATEGRTLLAYNTATDNAVQSDAPESLYFPISSFGNSYSTQNQSNSIDALSTNCLTCHDGGHASDVNVTYRNNPGSKTKSYDGTGQHPIGMDYAAYTQKDFKNYKPVTSFNSKMIFVDGKVGCLTCHNPLNPEKNHLVMNDYRSSLCQTCHNR